LGVGGWGLGVNKIKFFKAFFSGVTMELVVKIKELLDN